MKQKLEALGWTCRPCGCPGIKGYDCANNDHKGFIIKERGTRFKMYKNSLLIESGFAYELEEKMIKNELIK